MFDLFNNETIQIVSSLCMFFVISYRLCVEQ